MPDSTRRTAEEQVPGHVDPERTTEVYGHLIQPPDYDAVTQPPPMGGHARTEYGVMVDRTSKGLGFFLAETFTEPDRAHRMAAKAVDMFGYPALVQVRRVYVTDWQPCPIPPAVCEASS